MGKFGIKRIMVSVSETDFKKLKEKKGEQTWEGFLLSPHLKAEVKKQK